MNKADRRRFCKARSVEHAKRASEFKKDKDHWESLNTSKTRVFVACKNCGGGFVAKIADRRRGWAKFCSKSCKAQHQHWS